MMRTLAVLVAALLAVACQSQVEKRDAHAAAAARFFEAEKWDEAKIEYLNLLQLDPQNPDAHYKLAETYWKLNDGVEALAQYRDAVRLAPTNSEYRLRLGGAELVARRPDAALEHANAVLAAEPNSIDGLLLRSQVYAVQGERDGELADLARVIELDPKRPAPYALRARAFNQLGRHDDAEAMLKQLLGVSETPTSLFLYGSFLSERGRRDEAVRTLERAIEISENPAQRLQAQIVLANLQISIGNTSAAEATLVQARQQNPDNRTLLLQLARFYALLGNSEQAEKMLQEHATQRPDEVGPLLTLAGFYRRLDQSDKAFATVARALELDPRSEEARLLQAEYLMEDRAKDPSYEQRARALLDDVLKENPRSLLGLYTEAKFLLIEERPEDASDRLRRVLQEQPSANAHFLLGTAYLQLQNDELARAELQQALQLDGTNALARTQLAALYLRSDAPEAAVQEANAGLRATPASVPLRLILAEAQLRLRDTAAALAALQDLDFERSPDPEVLRVRAARVYRALGKLPEARALVEKTLATRPSYAAALEVLVEIEATAGQAREVLPRLDAAIAASPDDPELSELRAVTRLGFRDAQGALVLAKEAEQDLKDAIQKDPRRPSPYTRLANLYKELGNLAAAEENLKLAIEFARDRPEPLIALGTFYEDTGRPADASRQYEAALERAPGNALAMNNLAWVLASAPDPSEADLDRAMQLAQDAKERMPQAAAAADTLGYVMLRKGLTGASIALFKEAIDRFPPGPARAQAREHMSQAFERQGRMPEAVEQLEAAAAESPAALAPLALLYQRLERPKDAVAAYERAIARDPAQMQPRLGLAALHDQSGRREDAIRSYEAILKLEPEFVVAKNNLAYLLADRPSPAPKDLDRALQLAREAESAVPDNAEIRETLGWVHLKRKSFPEAIAAYNRAIEVYPAGAKRAVARYHLALAYERTGDTQQARSALQTALSEARDFPNRSDAEQALARLN